MILLILGDSYDTQEIYFVTHYFSLASFKQRQGLPSIQHVTNLLRWCTVIKGDHVLQASEPRNEYRYTAN